MNKEYPDFNGDEIILSIIGESKTGKSMICERFINRYNFRCKTEYRPTIGVGYVYKYIHDKRKNQNIRIGIWDIGGQKRFRDISKSYLRISHGIIMVYDVSDRKSFEELKKWRQDIVEVCIRNMFMLLIGNKSDLEEEREVSFEEGRKFAEGMGIKLIEVCAKRNDGVNYAFGVFVKDIVENYHSQMKEVFLGEMKPNSQIRCFSRKILFSLNEIICLTFKKSLYTFLLFIFAVFLFQILF